MHNAFSLKMHRLGGRDIKDRLGSRADHTPDMRECNQCKKIGHIARNCPELPRTSLPGPPPSRPQMIPLDSLAAHKTNGAVCAACKKPGHGVRRPSGGPIAFYGSGWWFPLDLRMPLHTFRGAWTKCLETSPSAGVTSTTSSSGRAKWRSMCNIWVWSSNGCEKRS